MPPLLLLFTDSIIVSFGVRSEAKLILDLRGATSAFQQDCSVTGNICMTGAGEGGGSTAGEYSFHRVRWTYLVELWNRSTIDTYLVGRCR